MSRGVNKVILVGNLGAEPDVRQTQTGLAITNLSIATTESWRDKETGQMQDKTEWHRVVLYKNLAEIAGKYLHKGSKVYIEGSLRTRKWQDKNGQDRYTTEISGQQLQMLDSKSSSSSDNQDFNGSSHSSKFDSDLSFATINDEMSDEVPF